MRRILLSLVLLALPLGACGTAGGGRGGFSSTLRGPALQALAVFLDGAFKTLVLRNLVDAPAQVNVTPIRPFPFGTGATQTVDVPARGETRRSVTSFGGLTDGWLLIDTSLTPATSGLVEPYLHTQRSGPDLESIYAALLQHAESVITVHPQVDDVKLLNAGAATTYNVRSFRADDSIGNLEVYNQDHPVGAGEAFDLDAALAAIQNQGDAGHISVRPVAPLVPLHNGFTLATHQDEGLVVEVDDRDETRGNVSRLLDPTSTFSAEWMVEYGRDPITGGYEDFDLLVSNVSDTDDVSFTVQSIYDEFGNPYKTTPRTFQVPRRQTRLFATTVVDSLGLKLGEIHPFAHAFGDVFVSSDRRLFRMNLTIDRRLLLSGRVFDPLALEFASGVRPTGVRRTTSVLMSDLQTTLAGGISNWAYLSNPSNNPITVQVRAHTAERGTEYQLPDVVIPPQGLHRFRGDGLHLKEEVGVPVLADVPFLRFLFSSNSAFGSRGRGEGRNGSGLLIFVTPHIVRHEE